MIRFGVVLALGLVSCFVSACTLLPGTGRGGGSEGDVLSRARGPEENQRLYTDLVRKMIDNDRLYAALAHLDARKKKYGSEPASRLLRAEVLRKLGRTSESQGLYNGLRDAGEFRGRAQHGLGLIDAKRDLAAGLEHLQKAAELRPTDARIRNDLGYALMKAGRVEDARLHLATAYQLDDSGSLARNNYIVALLVEGRKREASRIAAEAQLEKKTVKRLRERAAKVGNRAGRVSDTASVPDAPQIGAGGG